MSNPGKEKKKSPPQPLTSMKETAKNVGTLAMSLARRPLLWLVGAFACGVALLIETAIGPSGQPVFNLVSYVPFLGGAWAVYAQTTSSKDHKLGQLPNKGRVMSFALAALMVLVLSGLARITLTIIGELVVKTALALGPTVALAEKLWPPGALWRGLMVIDENPRKFAQMLVLSVAILLVTALAVPWAIDLSLGTLSTSRFVQGIARGLGWALISATWMQYYLRVRPHV